MKILTAEQIRALDKFTIENEPISSINLMERAASSCTNFLLAEVDKTVPYVIVCGKGNNGGDGLVIARQLHLTKREVSVIVVEHAENGSDDFKENLKRLHSLKEVDVSHFNGSTKVPELDSEAVIIDAMLGTGLSKPLHGLILDVVIWLNQLGNSVISIDMPTGLFAEDNSKNELRNVIHAEITLSFHCPKLSFLLPDSGACVGEFEVLDIGLMETEMNPSTSLDFVQLEDMRTLHRPRHKFSHKGTYGHALLVAGSKGKMGAAQLAALACLRSGAGLLTVHVPACGLEILQTGVKEAMCTVDSNADHIIDLPNLSTFNAIAIGPGIGTEKDTANVLKRLLQDADARLVIDADGLNILGENKTWLSFIPKGTILTPHPKEFERMAGSWESSSERLSMQQEFSKKHGVTVVLKGAYTCCTTPMGQTFFNSTGNPGMATAGSGDVLTGIILGLLAQGYSPEVAAVLGVYLHGSAGDLALDTQSAESLVAGDVIENLGPAMMELAI